LELFEYLKGVGTTHQHDCSLRSRVVLKRRFLLRRGCRSIIIAQNRASSFWNGHFPHNIQESRRVRFMGVSYYYYHYHHFFSSIFLNIFITCITFSAVIAQKKTCQITFLLIQYWIWSSWMYLFLFLWNIRLRSIEGHAPYGFKSSLTVRDPPFFRNEPAASQLLRGEPLLTQ
jgi:hypothetical protein